ncbi:MAG TPA: site-2 protease family protein [Cerasibacillus sp.]|uniref:site-2 protease family protein n=1 Tax=Cerasibacillus sp. TaxID=2498711 RepID=UPI002F4010AB
MDAYIIVYLLLFVAPISALIHESGHMIGSVMTGSNHVHLSIGYGKEMASFSTEKVHISIHLYFFLSGQAISERNRPYKTWELVFISICGPLNNVIFVFLFYFIYNIIPSKYILLLLFFNGWLAITNIIPYKVNKKRSDGYIVMKAIRQHFAQRYKKR